jgi:iron complex transport system substrate-binding protein
VSLAPAITETLFELGAGGQVVGVSDFCDPPPGVGALPRLGSGFTPNYEGIVRQQPDLILTDRGSGAAALQLAEVAPTHALAWLSVDEAVQSIRTLGAWVRRQRAADRLAAQLHDRLGVAPATDAPRVLLVHGVAAGSLAEVWLIQRNSLHGAVLRAAGGRNAVERDVDGAARMSLEEVVRLDPELIIVLVGADPEDVRARDRAIDRFAKLRALRAAREHRIGAVLGPSVFAVGPGIVALIEPLAAEIRRLRGNR